MVLVTRKRAPAIVLTFLQLPEWMEKLKVLWNTGSVESPRYIWWKKEVARLSLSPRKEVLKSVELLYTRHVQYSETCCNVQSINPKNVLKYLHDTDGISGPEHATTIWAFLDEGVPDNQSMTLTAPSK